MSTLSILILGLIIVFVFAIGLIKNIKVKTLEALLEIKNYDAIIANCESNVSRKILSIKVCNLYTLRAYYLKGDKQVFYNQLLDVIHSKDAGEENKKDLMEIYFHLFLFKDDIEYAKLILNEILENADESFKRVHTFAYDVAVGHIREDLKEMEDLIEEYKEFSLGVLVYYLGMAYMKRDDKVVARDFFYSCRSCFSSQHYYYKQAEKYVEELS